MFRNSFSMVKRIFRNLRNDKHTLVLMVLAPILVMFVFGVAFSGDVKDVRVMVVNADVGADVPGVGTVRLSDQILVNIDPAVMKLAYTDDEAAAIRQVQDGKAWGVITFPEHFTQDVIARLSNLSAPGDTTIQLRLDKSNVNVAQAINKQVVDALFSVTDQLGKQPPISVNADDAIFGQNARFIDFFVPGIMAFAVYMLTTLLTLLAFVGERTTGTLDRLLTTPVSPTGIVMGYATAFSLIGAGQSALLLLIGILVFKITIVGNVLLAFFVIVLLAIVSQSIGILLSSVARDEAQAIQMLPFIVLPAFLLAGIFWPLQAIPTWLRPLSYLIPPTYAVNASRSVMLRGWGLGKIWPDVLALLALAVVFLGGAIWSVHKHRA